MESVPGAAWQERGGEGISKKLRACLVVRQKNLHCVVYEEGGMMWPNLIYLFQWCECV